MSDAAEAPGAPAAVRAGGGRAGTGTAAVAGRRAADAGLRIEPAFEALTDLAASHGVVPVVARTIDDCETPVSAFLKLRAHRPDEPAFLLESAEQGRAGRYSFLGIRPSRTITWRLGDPGDPYAIARDAVGRHDVAEFEGLPPFVGGAVGVFAYDLVRTVEPLGDVNPDEIGTPDLALMVTDAMVVFDHLQHTITLLAPVHVPRVADGAAVSGSAATAAPSASEPAAASAVDGGVPADAADELEAGALLEQRWADAVDRIVDLQEALRGPVPDAPPRPDDTPAAGDVDWQANVDRETFEATVARIVEYVHAGDAFQVVPSQRFTAELGIDPFSVYRGLRVVNPSPYMYYLDFGDWQVAGASPEPLLTVSGDRISTRPIAGTRPRGATAAEDAGISRELLADEKERAEHVMLVDLGRNDLGRVCEYGSVRVDELMTVEVYSHLIHIVSAVSGRLRPGVSATDALRSVLPAGTLSGAPKVRAMQIIDELETTKRGGYGGAIGYLSWSGDLDSCIHIRTAVFEGGRCHVQAGGGTVADARPDYEYEESVNKSRAVRRAVELALEQERWG